MKLGQWWDVTLNPFSGCSPVSDGCRNCFAKRMAYRLKGRYGYPENDPFKVTFHPEQLEKLFDWKKGKRVFLCIMSDFFHEDISSHDRARCFRAMRVNPQHTYFILTKRPQNIPKWDWFKDYPNWWLGVSVEDQSTADERIPILLQIPVSHRFISIEPMLGSTNLNNWLSPCGYYCDHDSEGGGHRPDKSKLDWIVLGGETGPKARPCQEDWVVSVKNQCMKAGVPFFFKQWGSWNLSHNQNRLVDGREWNEYPNMR